MAMPEAFHELAGKVRNWGRWGADDEIGTLNLIDGEATIDQMGRAIFEQILRHASGEQTNGSGDAIAGKRNRGGTPQHGGLDRDGHRGSGGLLVSS